ncbi:MAG TPA: hypothetical protein PLF13_04750 [candidate division Zixibacteria bacterium]|nr:hypothetical protein [candidate division Zixibacteria bacterium]
MTKKHTKFRYSFEKATPWFLAVLAIVFAHWAATTTESYILGHVTEHVAQSAWPMIGAWALLVAVVALIYHSRDKIFHPHTRFVRGDEPEKRRHLILFLSNFEDHEKAGEWTTPGIPDTFSPTGDLMKDLERLSAEKDKIEKAGGRSKLWKWEMPLRGIAYHVGILESVTVICSPESLNQIDWFKNLIGKYQGPGGTLSQISFEVLARQGKKWARIGLSDNRPANAEGINFEEFEDLSLGIIWLLEKITSRKGKLRENDIMVDFTGGQKVTSVVAAAITFNREIDTQYVSTRNPWNVRSYDIFLGSAKIHGPEEFPE